MQQKDHIHFELLKKKIVAIMQQSYPGISPSISEWKGQDIVNFQEELLLKVNAHISEKWFYMHMKTGGGSLPRIDILNLLSKYAGYADWSDFVFKNGGGQALLPVRSGNRYFIIVPLLVIGVMGLLLLLFKMMNTREYMFCFYDTDTKDPITNTHIEVSLLQTDESPVNYLCSPDGCFTLKTDQSVINMVVNTPYYRNDTIRRVLKKFNRNEKIGLRANDYAMMIRFFSEMNVKDWENRRAKLSEIFDDAAMIYQVHNDRKATGLELYTKWEFIDKLTMPSQSLKHIEILDTKYVGDKISVLRFRISENE